ncbi:dolichyl-phosphate-mannose--protein mannosyltransferase [Leptospira hartskeerlii]|uniref:Dolichyl-phosphate-mannose--protein mannosyltransferase n=1 Tax=Leptospira hartskeerlii TaxID=2023177 RepID=A0A2M9XAN2_9LEPT|nr:dolichyl-phosphate-mannose--protein mannosyltransferase [Leptospira hartskeerlii]PJZ24743.1 dolichyl-phosphate-mannose--protein mannosyltransferase [Leptospira hartskeerlii]PJZ33165.1 dolichyl-phosphate-mannose--protein mannosyltransferase [Leptospira hartskeerlii]
MLAIFNSLFIGIVLISSSLTNQIVSGFSRPLAWVGFTLGIGFISYFFYKNRGKDQFNKNLISQGVISILTGIYISFYFFSPTVYGSLFANFKIFYILVLLSASLYISYYRTKKISDIWKNFSRLGLLTLFLLLFSIPTSVTRLFSSDDSNGAKLIPFSLEKDGNLDLSEFFINPPIIHASEWAPDKEVLYVPSQLPSGDYIEHPFFLTAYKGKLLSSFPLLPGLYNSFVYFSLKLIGVKIVTPDTINLSSSGPKMHAIEDFIYLEKFSSSLLFAITSILLFKAICKIASARTSLLITLLYSFGTTHFSNTSQTLWQHGFIEFLIVASIFLFLSKDILTPAKILLLGMILGCFFFVRPPSILVAGLLGLVFLWRLRHLPAKEKLNLLLISAAGLFIPLCSLGLLNYLHYGHIMGGYYLMEKSFALSGMPDRFIGNFWEGVGGLLISPGFGLFVFSPIVLLSFLGFFPVRKRIGFLILPTLLSTLAYLYIYGKHFIWWGGVSYATRFLTDLMPFFAVLLLPALTISYKRTILKFVFILFSIISVWAHTSAMYSDAPFKEWQGCKRLPIREKAWRWERIPYTMPFRAYYPYLTGKLDIEPIHECQMGEAAGSIGDRTAFKFEGSSVILGSEKVLRDITAYFRSGHYCAKIFSKVEKERNPSDEVLQILITQKDKIYMSQILNSDLSKKNEFEFDIAKSGKTKISVLKKGNTPVIFAGLTLTKGTCE